MWISITRKLGWVGSVSVLVIGTAMGVASRPAVAADDSFCQEHPFLCLGAAVVGTAVVVDVMTESDGELFAKKVRDRRDLSCSFVDVQFPQGCWHDYRSEGGVWTYEEVLSELKKCKAAGSDRCPTAGPSRGWFSCKKTDGSTGYEFDRLLSHSHTNGSYHQAYVSDAKAVW